MTAPHPAVVAGLPGRLHRAAHQHENPRRVVPTVFVITGPEASALNDYLRTLCGAEATCSLCGGRLCADCRIGDPVPCTHDPDVVHHSDCQDECDWCVASPVRAEP